VFEHGVRPSGTATKAPAATGLPTVPAARGLPGLSIEALEASYALRNGKQVLRPVSLTIPAGSLTAVVGPSGAGKTVLLDVLAGVTMATDGSVLHDGATCRVHDLQDVRIGYVPQDDIVHPALPLGRTLRYAAKLRLPDSATDAEIEQAVAGVLGALGLTEVADVRISRLSGGERKRASIGVELLSRPSALFLDEPTSGLDPATAADLVALLGRIAASGTTVVFTSHNPADIAPCDLVAVVAQGGQLAFSGPPDRAAEHFEVESFPEIYACLARQPDPEYWAGRRAALPPRRAVETRFDGSAPEAWRRRGPVRQWLLFTRRGFDLLTRSRLTLAIMVGCPVMIIVMFLMMFRPGAFDFAHPSPATSEMILFWIAFGGFFFGLTYGLSQICDEFAILRRERIVGLRIMPYLLSKVTLMLPVLAAVDAVLLAVLAGTGRLPSLDARRLGELMVSLLLASACALALGLLASAAVSSPQQATLMLPMLCFPQVLFVGAFLPVPVMALPGRIISILMTNRWAFEALGDTAGVAHLWRAGGSPLGPPLLASYGGTFGGSAAVDWWRLAGFAVFFLAAAAVVLGRKLPKRRRGNR
jgi:ABC-type multidrug transport system ATPase subunit